jgi:hypothetical protein
MGVTSSQILILKLHLMTLAVFQLISFCFLTLEQPSYMIWSYCCRVSAYLIVAALPYTTTQMQQLRNRSLSQHPALLGPILAALGP